MDANSSTSPSSPGPGGASCPRHPLPWRPLPWALLIAAAIILAAEAVFAANRPVLLDPFFRILEDKRAMLRRDTVPHDAVLFGGSSVFHIDPAIFSEGLGLDLDSANFSWGFCGMEVYDYAAMEYEAARGRLPAIVFVDFAPSFMAQDERTLLLAEMIIHDPNPTYATSRAFSALSTPTIVRGFSRDGNWRGLWDYLKYRLSPPSLLHRQGILSAAGDILRGQRPPVYEGLDLDRWTSYLATGAFPLYTDFAGHPEPMMFMLEDVHGPFRARGNPRVLAAFERFLDRVEAAGSRIVLLPSAMPEYMLEFYNERSAHRGREMAIERWRERYPGMVIIEPTLWIGPDAGFADPVHVNTAGAEAHNAWLRERITENRDRILDGVVF